MGACRRTDALGFHCASCTGCRERILLIFVQRGMHWYIGSHLYIIFEVACSLKECFTGLCWFYTIPCNVMDCLKGEVNFVTDVLLFGLVCVILSGEGSFEILGYFLCINGDAHFFCEGRMDSMG